LSQALAESLRPLERKLSVLPKDDSTLRAAESADVVEELLVRELGRTGQLPLPTRQELLDEITARIVWSERYKGDVDLHQRVARRWHHVMEKRWLPIGLPELARASEIVRRYRDGSA
jgi:hypothetical protein